MVRTRLVLSDIVLSSPPIHSGSRPTSARILFTNPSLSLPAPSLPWEQQDTLILALASARLKGLQSCWVAHYFKVNLELPSIQLNRGFDWESEGQFYWMEQAAA